MAYKTNVLIITLSLSFSVNGLPLYFNNNNKTELFFECVRTAGRAWLVWIKFSYSFMNWLNGFTVVFECVQCKRLCMYICICVCVCKLSGFLYICSSYQSMVYIFWCIIWVFLPTLHNAYGAVFRTLPLKSLFLYCIY